MQTNVTSETSLWGDRIGTMFAVSSSMRDDGQCLHSYFEARVDTHPERIAITFGEQHLSYGALDARANQLAHHLRSLGVGKDVLVAVCLERSCEFVIAVLAIFKAGGAYVPIDPRHPTDRVRFYVEDSQAPVLITRGDVANLRLESACTVLLDVDAERIDAFESTRLSATSTDSDRAYVIYTSGSTGKPKGVEVTHANVARLFTVTHSLFEFGETDTWSVFHSMAFDFSVWELFGALLYGGRAVLVPESIVREPREFAALVRSARITMLSQTPSAFRQLVPALCELNEPLALRCVMFGGEALELAMLRPFVDRFGDEKPVLVNMYGITEITIHATYRRIAPEDVRCGRGSPIGRPLADLDFLLLDANQKPVLPGATGEIFVVGPGVARGYLGREELTQERFIVLPDGRRAYRSGDLAKMRPNGEFEFCGRADSQVKIRGYRIELGEIQSVLLDNPNVADAAVVCREDGRDKTLYGYVVPKSAAELTTTAITTELTRRLPEYMIPSAIVVLDRLPLTINGKLDKAALALPQRVSAAHREPSSFVEIALCRIVARVLEIERVGLDDRFLVLGGHSLRAAEVARDLSEELNRDIGGRELLSGHTMAEIASRIEGLSRRPQRSTSPGLFVDDTISASSTQLGLWLHAQHHPADTAYNETLALTIPGLWDARAFESCLAEVVARHPLLRAAFEWQSGQLLQRIAHFAHVQLDVRDLRFLAREERASEAMRLAERAARIPFDLTVAPLFRALLVRLEDRENWFYLTVHHAICDARSLYNVAAEISETYIARRMGVEPQLPPLPPAYATLLAETNSVEAQNGSPRALPQRPLLDSIHSSGTAWGRSSNAGGRTPIRITSAVAEALRTTAAEQGATLFMTLFAAWHVLLYRYSGADEIVVGTVVDRRTSSDLIPLVGTFLGVTPIATHQRGNQSFVDVLGQVRAALLDALDAHIHGNRQCAGLLDSSFETAFGMIPTSRLLAGGIRARLLDVHNGGAKYDLSILLEEHDDGSLSGFLEHRSAIWSADFASRMVDHYVHLLAAISGDGTCTIRDLHMLGENERQQLLTWGHGLSSPLEDASRKPLVHQIFLDQARRTPSAIAIEWGDTRLSYAQLATRAIAIATKIREHGVQSETLVVVCLERSPDLIAALFGVLIAGAAFLPIDIAQPRIRMAQVLEEAQPSLILTSTASRGHFPQHPSMLLCLDEEQLPTPTSVEYDCAPVEPTALAYVLYTSGSTGRPKGVAIEHRSLTNLVFAWTRHCKIQSCDRVLQFARISFDATMCEIFATLAVGATLVIPDDTTPLVGADLATVLRERAITCTLLTPSVIATIPFCELPSLRLLIAVGEPCPTDLVDRWGHGREFFNGYGPTEATVCTTLARCEAGQSKLPIGRPIDNVEVYVLCPDKQLLPVGVPGELYIGGVGVARGYLNEPELTAERFVENPFRLGERLYRTGDRVVWRPDGQLEFRGRMDRQIKLRGFRIEPGEIESRLREHPAIQHAAVVVREGASQQASLSAYITLLPSDAPDKRNALWPSRTLRSLNTPIEHITQFLRDRVPDYMMPSSIVVVDALPLSAHGKLDLSRLPPPPAQRAHSPMIDSASHSLEARISAIFAELLGIAQVAHDESFFEAGGTSLLLAKAQERIELAFGRRFSIAVLFQHPTPRALAAHIRNVDAKPAEDAARAARIRQATSPNTRRNRRLSS